MDLELLSWKCFQIFLEILIFYIFLETSPGNIKAKTAKKHILKYAYLVGEFILLSAFILLSWENEKLPWEIEYLIFFASGILFAFLFYDGSVKGKISFGSLYCLLCITADFVTFLFIPDTISDIGPYQVPVLYSGGLMTSGILRNLAFLVVAVFTIRLIRAKNTNLTTLHKVIYTSFSLFGLLIAHYMTVTTIRIRILLQSDQIINRLVLINIFLILFFLTLLAYIDMLGRSTDTNMKLMKQQKIHELEAMEYENLIKSTEALREMKHDIQIHLDVIQNLASEGNTSDLLAYVRKYLKTLEHTHHFLSTGNAAIDCIVSSKLEAAKELGIETDISILIPASFSMDPLSLSSLLGNLWSNAIEACQKLKEILPDFHPHIRFTMKPYKNMVLIHMENDYDGTIRQTKDGSYLSTKKEKGHGIGLKRITDIVKENGGIIQINTDNKTFRVQIMLPISDITRGID